MAPDPVRAKFRGLTTDAAGVRAAPLPRLLRRPDHGRHHARAQAMLAERHRDLGRQITTLTARIDPLVTTPTRRSGPRSGSGPMCAAQLLITAGNNSDRLVSEASFAALCGVAPVPASSGKTRRYRLSRGGDRRANHAVHTIALVRMSHDPTTRAYISRQLDRGRSNKEILRILKRAICREIYRHLTRPCPVPRWDDLRPARQAKGITLTAVANHFGVWPATISTLERGLRRDDQLTTTYRTWLAAA